jgi:hypothetical protein
MRQADLFLTATKRKKAIGIGKNSDIFWQNPMLRMQIHFRYYENVILKSEIVYS